MPYYIIKPSRPKPIFRRQSRRWSLPGVHCSGCDNKWSMVGISYANISLEGFSHSNDYAVHRNVEFGEFLRLRAQLERWLPSSVPILMPGTDFGPLFGQASGSTSDFIWPTMWIALASLNILPYFKHLNLETAKTSNELHIEDKSSRDVVELQVSSFCRLSSSMKYRDIIPCPVCGRVEYSKPRNTPISIDQKSIPPNHLFRIMELPTQIVASDEFFDACKRNNVTGIEFTPIFTE
ncbi:SitI6 family double-CXXCG motif immunity protein [Tundrisphaera lichenicola]|uniref:SitI6 family double-CXXCG motif immunity protein n=1 Tax=Tundrisphaera lichenicola TaxID=2029860 RepID=UPI003EB830C2